MHGGHYLSHTQRSISSVQGGGGALECAHACVDGVAGAAAAAVLPQNPLPLSAAVHRAYAALFDLLLPPLSRARVCLADVVAELQPLGSAEKPLSSLSCIARRCSHSLFHPPTHAFPLLRSHPLTATSMLPYASSPIPAATRCFPVTCCSHESSLVRLPAQRRRHADTQANSKHPPASVHVRRAARSVSRPGQGLSQAQLQPQLLHHC